MIILAFTACREDCHREEGWCEGDTLRTCSKADGSHLGSRDRFEGIDCGRMGAVCLESEAAAACVLRDAQCEPDARNVCRGSSLHACFEGFALLGLGDWRVDETHCEHACMRSQPIGMSYCVEPDPTCVRAGSVRCLSDPNTVGGSRPDFEVCIEPGWSALGDCGAMLELCLDPADESDPCIPLDEARARLDAGTD